MAMKLSTGKVAFPIEFDNGDKQNIYFNPNDPNLYERMKELQVKVENRTKEIEDISMKDDGSPEDMEFMEAFSKVKKIICEEMDIAFGGDVSSVVFKYCSPFAIVGGRYFIIQFLEAIKPEIEKHIKKATEELQKNMQKHIAKYSK